MSGRPWVREKHDGCGTCLGAGSGGPFDHDHVTRSVRCNPCGWEFQSSKPQAVREMLADHMRREHYAAAAPPGGQGEPR